MAVIHVPSMGTRASKRLARLNLVSDLHGPFAHVAVDWCIDPGITPVQLGDPQRGLPLFGHGALRADADLRLEDRVLLGFQSGLRPFNVHLRLVYPAHLRIPSSPRPG